ncbi:MAG: hypothetical protein N2712_04790 [Brevinematales bacterium]|nr:hypothetical protein [Brevinematales bacterium]
MFGVIILSLMGMIYGFLSAGNFFKKLFRSDLFERFLNRVDRFDLVIGSFGIFIGLWNLFSPNFGFKTGITGADLTILGATIPSLLIIMSGISISLHYILQVLNIEKERKDQILRVRSQYGDLIGILTFIFSLLHVVTYQTILL